MSEKNCVTKVKFCGMSRECDIAAVNEAGCDYCGFVVNYPKSHRSVNFDQLKQLSSKLDIGIKSVGVFVDEDEKTIIDLLNDDVIDVAQLHGNESDKTIRRIKENTTKEVIKAFCISPEKADYEEILAKAAESPADSVLIDTGKGGGVSMNFLALKEAIEKCDFRRDYFLAGGLNSKNISDAIKILNPFAIDLSGGIETDKLKDAKKMMEVMDLLH